MKKTALARLIFLAANMATVTAGLMWPPETWAIAQTMVPTDSPKHRAICTIGDVVLSLPLRLMQEPHPTRVSRRVPTNSAMMPFHSRKLDMSSKLVAILGGGTGAWGFRRTALVFGRRCWYFVSTSNLEYGCWLVSRLSTSSSFWWSLVSAVTDVKYLRARCCCGVDAADKFGSNVEDADEPGISPRLSASYDGEINERVPDDDIPRDTNLPIWQGQNDCSQIYRRQEKKISLKRFI